MTKMSVNVPNLEDFMQYKRPVATTWLQDVVDFYM